MALTPEEEKRKEAFGPRPQAWLKASTEVFFNGDEDAAWRAVFKIEDRDQPADNTKPSQPTSTRTHLKATHLSRNLS